MLISKKTRRLCSDQWYEKFAIYHAIGVLALCLSLSASTVVAETQTISLSTESYPPFNMKNEDGKIIGLSTEVVRKLFSRTNTPYDIKLYSWTKAYNLALEKTWHGVFSTTRTTEREPLFQWVGPLVNNKWVFLAKKSRHINISSLADAKKYRIGGYRNDAIALYLQSQGFTPDITAKDELNVMKLDRDRIDLWATGHLLGPYYARQKHIDGLEAVFTFRTTVMSIAFNKNTPSELIDQLNGELQKMYEDGTMEEIYQHYE